ncbi:MAG: MFS transporter [Chloroflexi bacterium]|nr:MFS transporter [Chloroflexota bacterium]
MVTSEFNRILVPLDGSPNSEQIIMPAASLAHSTGSSMVLVQVVPTGGGIRRMTWHPFRRSTTHGRLSQQDEISDYLRGLAEGLREEGIEVAIDAAQGEVAEEIVALGTRHRASLIAMCTHGRTGLRRIALGSVAEQVLRRSALPLLLYRPTHDAVRREISWRKLVVPLDGSPLSELALQQASAIATAGGLNVELVHVLSDSPEPGAASDGAPGETQDHQAMETYLRERAEAISQQGVQVSYRFLNGDPRFQMVEAAQAESDNLVVMSTHGRTGLGRMMHGSVADHMVRNSSAPVLLVRGRPSTIGGGRYRLLRLLGEGNKKEVYLGYDTQDEREVAVTLVKSHILSPQQVDQIKAGAESISTVGDQVAAPLYLDVGEDQGYIYMISAALEYVEERILNPNFLLVSLGTLLVAVSLSILHPTIPLHVQAIGGTATDVSRVVGVMGLSQLLIRPFVGWLVDGKGRKPIAVISLTMIAAACLVLAAAQTTLVLMLGQFLMGVGFAMGYTSIVTMVGEVVPPDRRGESQAAFGLFPQLGLGLGPVIGIWLMLGQFLSFGSGAQETAAQTGSFTFAALAAAAVAGASVVAFLFVRDPYRPQGLRRLPKLSDSFRQEAALAAVVNFGVWMARVATFTILPIYAVQQGLNNPGLFLMIVALGSFPAKQLTGRASDRYGFAVVFLPSLILIGVSVLLIPMTHSAFGLLVLGAILGLGLGAAIPSLTAFAAGSVSSENRGAAVNTFTVGRDLAMSVGALSLGFITAHSGINTAFLVAGLSPLLAIVFYGGAKGLAWVRVRARATDC